VVGVAVVVLVGVTVGVLVGVEVEVELSVPSSVKGGEGGAPIAARFADAPTDGDRYAIAVRKATRTIPSRMQTLFMEAV